MKKNQIKLKYFYLFNLLTLIGFRLYLKVRMKRGTAMGKQQSNKKKKREIIYNTAYSLFTTKGFNKTTISDIVEQAGVAKGTFYLYFTDKTDIKNKLVSKKAGELFLDAHSALTKSIITDFEDKVIFIADHIINLLNNDKSLLKFISKNLSWGIFRRAIDMKLSAEDFNIFAIYYKMATQNPLKYDNPELMLFTIIELIGSTCPSCILYNEPVSIEEFKPRLYQTIRSILSNFSIKQE